jgi:hypothetical protein
MKRTRKQKLQRRKKKQQRSGDRKLEIIQRLLELFGVSELFAPFVVGLREGLVLNVNPQVLVEPAEDAGGDLLVAQLCDQFEEIIDEPGGVLLGDRVVFIALADFFRGYNSLVCFIKMLGEVINDPRSIVRGRMLEQYNQTMTKIDEFERNHLPEVFARALWPLDQIVYDHLRVDEQIVWYKIESILNCSNRTVTRVIIGKKKPALVSLTVSEGVRKAYPCECLGLAGGLRQLTWNPEELGIGPAVRDLPVFVGKHAIERLHERVPLAPFLSILHKMMCDAIEEPTLLRGQATGEYLVPVGGQGRKVGYFVAEVRDEFVYLRTFLFLTMQGTPEADCLREKLRLSRSEIEYYKLDNYFTFTMSDLGQDAELREALAQCNCAHLLDIPEPNKRLPWLDRYQAPFRKRVGLSLEGLKQQAAGTDVSTTEGIESMTEYSRKILKSMQGWIVE